MAIPSATRARRQEVLRSLQSYSLHVRTIPGLMDLASGKVKVDDLQESILRICWAVMQYHRINRCSSVCIKGQAVMVTGAGGSIGSELCRQIVQSNPKTLVLLSTASSHCYEIHSELIAYLRTQSNKQC